MRLIICLGTILLLAGCSAPPPNTIALFDVTCKNPVPGQTTVIKDVYRQLGRKYQSADGSIANVPFFATCTSKRNNKYVCVHVKTHRVLYRGKCEKKG